jgi:hypothetical protein
VSDPTPNPAISDKDVNKLQQLTGTLLYYARAVDTTLSIPINVLASEQSNATEVTADKVLKLLNYCHTHPETKIRYHASDMILHIQSDASYLSENEANSRAEGFFYMGNTTQNDKKLTDGAILIVSKVLKHVISSAAKAEIGAVFINAKAGAVLRTTLEELGHKQPPTPMETDNTTATGYINALLLDQRSGETRTISNLLGPRFSKFGGLFHKTPFTGASQKNTQRIHSCRRTTDKSERNSGFRIARVC